MDKCTTLAIHRPDVSIELISMSNADWLGTKKVIFYPDTVCGASDSDFPYSGITVCCKWQGHFVIGSGHREKWVFSNTMLSEIDLVFFGPEWTGCRATLHRA